MPLPGVMMASIVLVSSSAVLIAALLRSVM
jgi:hypothetical protein